VTRLRAGRSKNCGSIAGRDKRFCSPPNHPYRSRILPNLLLNGYLRFKRAGRVADNSYHKVLGLRISGDLPPVSDTLSWYTKWKLYLRFSYCCTVNFCRITKIYQPTNAHIILHKTLLKHFKTLRHVSILSDHHQGALFLAKVMLQYSQFNWYATAPQHIPTQHDMLPQHLVCKYELNCEYCNITLAGNKAPRWWSDKIETCRSVLKCFKSVLCEIMCAFVGW